MTPGRTGPEGRWTIIFPGDAPAFAKDALEKLRPLRETLEGV